MNNEKIKSKIDDFKNSAEARINATSKFLKTRMNIILIILCILSITIIWSLFNEINKTLNTQVYEIKFYTTEEAEEKFGWWTEDSLLTIKALIWFWSIFTYNFLIENWNWFSIDTLYELVWENIKNYNSNNLNFDQIWDKNQDLILNVKRINSKYNLFWNNFNQYIFQNTKVNDSKWDILKDIFSNGWNWNYTKLSCLNRNKDWKRTIWCSDDIWYYIALKEFLLEENDIDITFPLSIKTESTDWISLTSEEWWDKIYLKKFNKYWEFTSAYNNFINFLKNKNITNIFYISWWFSNKNELLTWFKKVYFYKEIFDWALKDQELSNYFLNNSMQIISDNFWQNIIDLNNINSWNYWPWSVAWMNTDNNNTNTNNTNLTTWKKDNKDKWKENKKEDTNNSWIIISTEISEENWDQTFHINNLNEINKSNVNYIITRNLTESTWKTFNNVLTLILDIDNQVEDNNWECYLIINWWKYWLRYDYSICESIKKMKWQTSDSSLMQKFIWTKDDNISNENITSINFQIPTWTWIKIINNWWIWIWVAWIQKLNNRDFYWIKKIYFPKAEQRVNINNDQITQVWSFLFLLTVVFLYYWSYIIIITILTSWLVILYSRLSKQFTDREETARDMESYKETSKTIDEVIK